MYLPDTNIFIRAIQGKDSERKFLDRIISDSKVVISTVVVAEFLSGVNKTEEIALDKLIRQFGVLIIDENVARAAAEYRKQFLRKTKRIFIMDCFLAAQAKLNKLILVTNNKSDFPMEDIKIITPF